MPYIVKINMEPIHDIFYKCNKDILLVPKIIGNLTLALMFFPRFCVGAFRTTAEPGLGLSLVGRCYLPVTASHQINDVIPITMTLYGKQNNDTKQANNRG